MELTAATAEALHQLGVIHNAHKLGGCHFHHLREDNSLISLDLHWMLGRPSMLLILTQHACHEQPNLQQHNASLPSLGAARPHDP